MDRDNKALLERKRDRDRLFTTKPDEKDHASVYQRMRYEREIEGQIYVALLGNGLSHTEAAKRAREDADRIVAHWKPTDSIYEIVRQYQRRISNEPSISSYNKAI